MSSPTQSLLEFLRRDNPLLTEGIPPKGVNSKSKSHNWVRPHFIERWNDFEYESLQAIDDGRLDAALRQRQNFPNHSLLPPYPFLQIHDEDSLESLLIGWNYRVVSDALTAAQNYLKNFPVIYMARGGQADNPGSLRIYRPDWAGVQETTNSTGRPSNILPGDTKVSKKWHSGKIRRGDVHRAHKAVDWLQPLSQIYTYCVWANARYGFIITDEELVVIRVRPSLVLPKPKHNSQSKYDPVDSLSSTPATRARTSGILEYRAIPWRSSKRGMTVNLALWWLYMMAAAKSDIEEDYEFLRDSSWDFGAQSSQSTPVATLATTSQPKPTAHHSQAGPTPPPSGERGKKRPIDDVLVDSATNLGNEERRKRRIPLRMR